MSLNIITIITHNLHIPEMSLKLWPSVSAWWMHIIEWTMVGVVIDDVTDVLVEFPGRTGLVVNSVSSSIVYNCTLQCLL